jgi:protein TonB
MHSAEMGPVGGGGPGPEGPRLPTPARSAFDGPVSRPALGLFIALVVHALLGVAMFFYARYRLAHPEAPRIQKPLEIAVVEKEKPPPPAPPKAEEPKPPPPKPKPKPIPMKVAKAPPKPVEQPPPPTTERPPPPPSDAPPRPTVEAKGPPTKDPVAIVGLTMESTTQGGSFAVGVGNTLAGAPSRQAKEPTEVRPYKAEKYAAAATVSELPRVVSQPEIRRFYPPEALKSEFEGDVVLRLLIDFDGSIAKVDVVSDPGRGLGQAAVQAIREFRFSPGKVNGQAVATTVPFVIHFVIN